MKPYPAHVDELAILIRQLSGRLALEGVDRDEKWSECHQREQDSQDKRQSAREASH
jgi:hypothetical protein